MVSMLGSASCETIFSGFVTIRWASHGMLIFLAIEAATLGPKLTVGVKDVSAMSKCSMSSPLLAASLICLMMQEKSASRMEPDINTCLILFVYFYVEAAIYVVRIRFKVAGERLCGENFCRISSALTLVRPGLKLF